MQRASALGLSSSLCLILATGSAHAEDRAFDATPPRAEPAFSGFCPPITASADDARLAAAEQRAYLGALASRFGRAAEPQHCYPDNLPPAERERIITETELLAPVLWGLDPNQRFFPAGTVWTGDGAQGPSRQAIPVRFTYSFPPDGTLWGLAPRPVVPNDLNSALAFVFGGTNPDLGREYMRQALAGWRRTANMSYTEVADDGSQHDFDVARRSTRGDIRIGAGFPWPDSYLAYNFFPDGGSDMFFNSRYWEGNFFARPDNSYRYLRNTTAHEHGHGIGCFHVTPCTETALMEPFISVAYEQQQIDDIRNSHTNYGDRYAGNTSPASAKDFGNLTSPSVRSVFERTLSTNGAGGPGGTGEDWFRFTTSSTQDITITVTPTGGTYVNGSQSSSCSGPQATVNASAAGNLAVELRDSAGAVTILSASSAPAGIAEVINAPGRPAGTYTLRVVDNGPNDPVNQILQTYDLTVRVGASFAPPTAIAGLNKRIGTGTACYFMGDINSFANDSGASITQYDWDLDGDGTFETIDDPRPSTDYNTPGTRAVTLRVTDSNGMTDTDTINVEVFDESFSVNAISPYPWRQAQGTTVPITIFGKGLSAITSVDQITLSGSGITLIGVPNVSADGATLTGLSAIVDANAPKGARVVTVTPPGDGPAGTAAFYLYPLEPGNFQITSPSTGSVIPTATPTFYWTDSPDAVLYFVQIASDAAFSSVVMTSLNASIGIGWQASVGVLQPNTTYFVRVRAQNETGISVFTPTVMFTTGAVSGNNDACDNAIRVFDGLTPYTNGGATTDGPDDEACFSGGQFLRNDTWYTYTATCSGSLTVALCGSTHDSMLSVYDTQCPDGPNQQITCMDDGCGLSSFVTFACSLGRTYVIRTGGWGGQRGYGHMVITCTPACPGDADGDALVGLSDIAVMILHWEQPVQPGTNGDLSADGIIGPDDISVVITNWGSNCNQDLRIGDEGLISGQGSGGTPLGEDGTTNRPRAR